MILTTNYLIKFFGLFVEFVRFMNTNNNWHMSTLHPFLYHIFVV